jgi:hypothetical protein
MDDSIQCKTAELKVLECSNFLLSKPLVEDLNSLNAVQFILKWMGQTPDYTFSFDDKLYTSIKSDMMLSGRYLASQSKVAIIDRPKDYDNEFQLKYITIFLEYCADPKNTVKPTSRIKKLIEAKQNGKLREELVQN